MATVGFVGLGMLGLPMALAIASCGHQVRGYDADSDRMSLDWYPGMERGPDGEDMASIAARSAFRFETLERVVAGSEILFITVQTPNLGGYDGTAPFSPAGFSYDLQPLRQALAAVASVSGRASSVNQVVAVVSTVLPGTLRELGGDFPSIAARLAHTPAFSAIGTMVRDFLDPEFVLIGAAHEEISKRLESFYRTLTRAPIFNTTLENAELIKTSYNGFIGIKISFANALMELAHKTPGCDVDRVVDCLSLATRRLISTSYLRGGLGDGGGCHPKENAGLAALAQRVKLSYDPFGTNLIARDRQTEWLARLIRDELVTENLPLWMLGSAFKANVSTEHGSPALLLYAALERLGLQPRVYDPLVPGRDNPPPNQAAVFVLAVPHDVFKTMRFSAGSVVVDPWRCITSQQGVRLVSVGRGS